MLSAAIYAGEEDFNYEGGKDASFSALRWFQADRKSLPFGSEIQLQAERY